MKTDITLQDVTKIDLRVGTVLKVLDFPKAHKPAYQLYIDFGDLGLKKTSAQITDLYSKEELVGKQIIAVVNFPPKQIANFMSECLVLGATTKAGVSILQPEMRVKNGRVLK